MTSPRPTASRMPPAGRVDYARLAIFPPMNIELPREQEQWLNARVAQGEFDSPEAAVRRMIADRMAFETDDFAWAKPDVEAARRGDVVSLDEAVADMDGHLKSLKD